MVGRFHASAPNQKSAHTMRQRRLRTSASDHYQPRSGAGLRSKTAKAPLAPAVFRNRFLERGTVEVGPVNRNEHQLTVSRLPKQEVGQALLTAGADDEVGVGQIRRVEVLSDEIGGHRGRVDAPGSGRR